MGYCLLQRFCEFFQHSPLLFNRFKGLVFLLSFRYKCLNLRLLLLRVSLQLVLQVAHFPFFGLELLLYFLQLLLVELFSGVVGVFSRGGRLALFR